MSPMRGGGARSPYAAHRRKWFAACVPPRRLHRHATPSSVLNDALQAVILGQGGLIEVRRIYCGPENLSNVTGICASLLQALSLPL